MRGLLRPSRVSRNTSGLAILPTQPNIFIDISVHYGIRVNTFSPRDACTVLPLALMMPLMVAVEAAGKVDLAQNDMR
jgi:hypothetical protein